MDSNALIALIFQLVVLIFSAIIHEIAHGAVAERLGDPTARLAGRLTLNPLKHLDPFGSVILPLGLYLLSGGAFVFGWAKPVPYNPYNLKNPRTGAAKIAAAGPLSNLFMAVVFGILLRTFYAVGYVQFAGFLGVIVYINIMLAIFNLVPLPPLDGSKVLLGVLRGSQSNAIADLLEHYGTILLVLFLFWGIGLIQPIISVLYGIIVGSGFGI